MLFSHIFQNQTQKHFFIARWVFTYKEFVLSYSEEGKHSGVHIITHGTIYWGL